MLHSFFIQMAQPVLLFYTTSITFFTTNLLLHFFFAAAAVRKESQASQAPAVSSCCNCLRLQEPLHPLEILHKLQRSSCFQPLKSSRPEKSRLLKLTTTARRRKRPPLPSLPKYFRLPGLLLPVESKAANYSANLRCSFKADFLKKYVEQW